MAAIDLLFWRRCFHRLFARIRRRRRIVESPSYSCAGCNVSFTWQGSQPIVVLHAVQMMRVREHYFGSSYFRSKTVPASRVSSRFLGVQWQRPAEQPLQSRITVLTRVWVAATLRLTTTKCNGKSTLEKDYWNSARVDQDGQPEDVNHRGTHGEFSSLFAHRISSLAPGQQSPR